MAKRIAEKGSEYQRAKEQILEVAEEKTSILIKYDITRNILKKLIGKKAGA